MRLYTAPKQTAPPLARHEDAQQRGRYLKTPNVSSPRQCCISDALAERGMHRRQLRWAYRLIKYQYRRLFSRHIMIFMILPHYMKKASIASRAVAGAAYYSKIVDAVMKLPRWYGTGSHRKGAPSPPPTAAGQHLRHGRRISMPLTPIIKHALSS